MKWNTVTGWILMASVLLAAGCKSGGQASWGTKERSYYDPAMPEASLNLTADTPTNAPPEKIEEDAISILMQAARSSEPLLRANAVEGLTRSPEHFQQVIEGALADENRGVRFVAAMSVGRMRLVEYGPSVELLLADESASVQAAAMFALKACGRPVDLNPLAEMLFSTDPEIKANAALVLGELGNRSAVPMLQAAVGKGIEQMTPIRARMVDLQLAEALVMLGADNQIDAIRAALFTRADEAELAVLACQMCGRLKDGKSAPDLNNILAYSGRFRRPAELRMAAAAALAEIEPTRAASDVPMAYIDSEQFTLRGQAALTLGSMGDPLSLPALAAMLSDRHPVVQVSAAAAILKICRR